ncbi:hypothetical protein SPRG_12161 [Saprolegnia parasitica CBS 223.65]|uniref:Uncharacterized protein n=1 Tax=Saprolegnia parasitica (strain CBS 223.65) TaxID=695850 RepID=A0A067BW61_SAPPC|nr:hypothetical protein SPRG_12161 [Saprolegnia parasitica CBS 223.65]KDO22734.1 hypothetical protein SPRG_12161 [Saprolegnia parasitica CBS 223.65]|eukprot:XP_012206522.1 hypothetical protein SPRG_12161 [Saprolegnia parasitica CBS 223.65]
MSSNPALMLVSCDDYATDVEPALADGPLKNAIAAKEPYLAVKSCQQSMKLLMDVTKLLETATAASHGFPCSSAIINTLGRYQSLVVDTDIAADAFLRACMQVLKNYKTAFALRDKKKFDLVKKLLASATKIAKRMETIADELATTSKAAASIAQASLDETINANPTAIRMNQEQDETKTTRKTETEDHTAANKRCKCEATTHFNNNKCEAMPVKDANEMTATDRRDNEAVIAETHLVCINDVVPRQDECIAALRKQQKSNQAISDIVLQLSSPPGKGETYNMAIAALKMTVQALGSTTTSFEGVRDFWSKLASKTEDVDLLVDSMTDDWYTWLALAKINYAAVTGMADVKKSVHRVMSDLPNSMEAEARLPGLLKELQAILKDKDTDIAGQIKRVAQRLY